MTYRGNGRVIKGVGGLFTVRVFCTSDEPMPLDGHTVCARGRGSLHRKGALLVGDLVEISYDDTSFRRAEGGEVIETLIDRVLEYNLYQIAAVLPRMGDVIYFGDDLGIQRGLAIGAERWRKYLAPCYRKMYGLIKSYKPSQVIYMHTDGCIHEIMPDLVACGVDIINPQFRANGIDNLVRVCRREQTITINLDLDRQLFPFATRSEIFDHVGECVESLYMPAGGLGLNVELDHGVSLENMAAVLDAVEKYHHYKY